MTPLFAGFLIPTVHKGVGARYPGIMILVMAVYASYAMISAVVKLVQCRKHMRPALSAAGAVSLTAALMSLLSLTTAIMSRFSDPAYDMLRQGIIGTAGGEVCVFVLALSIHIVTKAAKLLRQYGSAA